jgi:aspartyl-tRNA(Asn)/glutamyl-tRNA(Gln) amidotransferase subunit B
VEHLESTLPMLPDDQIQYLVSRYGITFKDAKTLVSLDHGIRLDYLNAVVEKFPQKTLSEKDLGRVASNW